MKAKRASKAMTSSIIKLDYFGYSFFMKLDQGVTSLNTWSGLVLTIILGLIIVSYSIQKINVLRLRQATDILENELDAFFNYQDVFDYENHGLNLAFAFTAYDNSTEPNLDPTIGELVAK